LKTLEIIEYLNSQWPPAVQTLDGKAIKFDITKQSLEMSFIANQNFCHSVDVVQGGYISAMLDAVMAYTVIGLPDVRKMVSTLELKTSYISIGHPGLMIGRGMITKLGKSIVFLNGELFQNNNLIATATSTAKILYKK
jgi:acyl-coenzyme A thioesterase PaaI-like protein